MQMIERPWGVAVYGAASVKSQPDLVRTRFRVSRLEQTAAEAFAAASDAVRAVRVDFDVTAKAELRAEARRQAVAAARRKAELYAQAAGVRLGAVLHIDDVDPEQAGFERYRGHDTGGAATPQNLAPGHVVVSAAVILGFAINNG
jgi:uncharacterized protein YggE